jgi:hypothetical protein
VPANTRTGGSERRCYTIRVRGPVGPTVMEAFPTLTATRSGQDTVLAGSLRDQSALYGMINQLEALGLQLLEIRSRSLTMRGRRAGSDNACEDDSSCPA